MQSGRRVLISRLQSDRRMMEMTEQAILLSLQGDANAGVFASVSMGASTEPFFVVAAFL